MKEAIITGPVSTPDSELTPMRVHEIALLHWCNCNFFVRDGYPIPVIFAKPMDAFGQFRSLWKEPNNPFTYLLNAGTDKSGKPLYQPYPEPARLPLLSINRRKQAFRTLQNYSIHRNRHVSWPTVSDTVTREDLGTVRVRNRPMAVSFHLDMTFLCLRPDTQAVFMQRVWNCFWRSGGKPQTWIPVAYPTEMGPTNVHMELESDIVDTTADDPGDNQVMFRTSFSVRIDGWQLDLRDQVYPAIWYQVLNFNLAIAPRHLLPLFSIRTDMRPIEENYTLDHRRGTPAPPSPLPPVTVIETEFISPPAGGYRFSGLGTLYRFTGAGTLIGGDSVISGTGTAQNFTSSGTLAGGDSVISGASTGQDFIAAGTLAGGDSMMSGAGVIPRFSESGQLTETFNLTGDETTQNFTGSGTLDMQAVQEYAFLPSDTPTLSTTIAGFAVDGTTAYCLDNANNSFSSTDGISWTAQGTASGNMVIMAFGAGVLVAAGYDGSIQSSSNGGATWDNRTSGISSWVFGIVYGGGRFVCVGEGGVTVTSVNGTTGWTSSTAGSSRLEGVCYGNGLFVAVGDGPVIYTSANGTSWTPRTPPTTAATTLMCVTFCSALGLFIAGGDGGTVLTSVNGTTDWTDRSGDPIPTYDTVNGIAWNNDHLALATQRGSIFASPDGQAWSHIKDDTNTNLNSERNIYPFGQIFCVLEQGHPV